QGGPAEERPGRRRRVREILIGVRHAGRTEGGSAFEDRRDQTGLLRRRAAQPSPREGRGGDRRRRAGRSAERGDELPALSFRRSAPPGGNLDPELHRANRSNGGTDRTGPARTG